jgi:regulator of sirC expression with transglutaminase-like and TPR domain
MALGLNEQARDDLSAYVNQASNASDVDIIRLRLASLAI